MATMAALLLVVLATVAPAQATDYTVGDSTGWTRGTDYNTWLSGKTFNAGDRLLFSYSFMHSVSEVSKSDYDACSATNSLQTYTDGSTTVNLTATGTRYFICGTLGHCSGGMKLAVNVGSCSGSGMDAGAPATTPSTTTGSATDNPSTKSTQSTNAAAGSNGLGAAAAGGLALVGLALIG